MSLTVFLSAVSSEFHHKDTGNPLSFESYRDVLTRSLRWLVPDCTVTTQEDLRQGFEDLLATLDGEVAQSTLVIHLVGFMAGAFPSTAEVRRLRERHPDWLAHERELAQMIGDADQVSYTQWEMYLAFEHRVGRLLFLADETAPRSPGCEQTDEQRASQARHRERLRITGQHYETCHDQRDLARRAVAAIERHGLRGNPLPPARPEVVRAAREDAAAFALQVGTQLRQFAKAAVTDADPAGIEAFLRAVDTAALKRELDRRTALAVLQEHRDEVYASVADDPTPENLYELAFAELAVGRYREAIDAARRLVQEQVALMSSEPDQYEPHREQALNAYLLWHEAAHLSGRVHESVAEYLLEHARYDKAEALIDEILDIREEQGEGDPVLAKSLLLWCGLLYALGKYQSVVDVAFRAEHANASIAEQSCERTRAPGAVCGGRATLRARLTRKRGGLRRDASPDAAVCE